MDADDDIQSLRSRNLIILRIHDAEHHPIKRAPWTRWRDNYRWRWHCQHCGKRGRSTYADWEYIASLGLDHVQRRHPTLDRLLRAMTETEDCPECGLPGPVGQHFDGRDFTCIRDQTMRDLARERDLR